MTKIVSEDEIESNHKDDDASSTERDWLEEKHLQEGINGSGFDNTQHSFSLQ